MSIAHGLAARQTEPPCKVKIFPFFDKCLHWQRLFTLDRIFTEGCIYDQAKICWQSFPEGQKKRVFLLKVLDQVYLRYTCEAVSFQRETAHVGNTPKTRIFRGI